MARKYLTKRFNGVPYSYWGFSKTKRGAKRLKKSWKNKGDLARIVKVSKGYEVYYKVKRKKGRK